MHAHTTFEVHLTRHPDAARLIRGLTEQEARLIAGSEHGVLVERLMSLDAVDALSRGGSPTLRA
jgi:hypothetical protein